MSGVAWSIASPTLSGSALSSALSAGNRLRTLIAVSFSLRISQFSFGRT
jgi:hypothetical protein